MPVSQRPPRAVARVRAGAIQANCRTLNERVGGEVTLCAVVKADGYGHGAGSAARAALAGGAEWLAVATAAEAAELRAQGIVVPVLVMGALSHDEADLAMDNDADVVVWTQGFLEAIAPRRPRVHVKLDTGMGRLGTADVDEARALVRAVDLDQDASLAGVMTHFATADEPGDDHFPRQLERFRAFADQVRADHPGAIAHAANSAATLRDRASHFDMVRCGIAIYGMDPFQQDAAEQGLEPALELHSYVAAVKRFEPGDSAGYGRRWAAEGPTWVATLPIGYGDGWRRALTNDCDVLIGGRRYPLVGTVSMDNITVDLGPDTGVEVGEPAVLIGAQGGEAIAAEEVARRLGTINYEVTCGISARVPRVEV
ncbi:MAG TPA: alanine racemase [Thermoleophilaceae bacterium]|nr:alanine racemase [Thermoleophilaceae bacterium]